MAQFQTIASSTGEGSGTARTCNAPAGIVAGDLLIASISHVHDSNGAGRAIAPPAGWTQLFFIEHDFSIYYIWTRVAGASEPATYTFTHNGVGSPQNWAMAIARYDEVSAVGLSDSLLSGSQVGPGTPVINQVCPSIIPVPNDSLLVNILLNSNGWEAITGVTPPGGVTERLDIRSPGAAYPNFVGVAYGDELLAASGPTGTRTWVAAAVVSGYGFSIELQNVSSGITGTIESVEENDDSAFTFGGDIFFEGSLISTEQNDSAVFLMDAGAIEASLISLEQDDATVITGEIAPVFTQIFDVEWSIVPDWTFTFLTSQTSSLISIEQNDSAIFTLTSSSSTDGIFVSTEQDDATVISFEILQPFALTSVEQNDSAILNGQISYGTVFNSSEQNDSSLFSLDSIVENSLITTEQNDSAVFSLTSLGSGEGVFISTEQNDSAVFTLTSDNFIDGNLISIEQDDVTVIDALLTFDGVLNSSEQNDAAIFNADAIIDLSVNSTELNDLALFTFELDLAANGIFVSTEQDDTALFICELDLSANGIFVSTEQNDVAEFICTAGTTYMVTVAEVRAILPSSTTLTNAQITEAIISAECVVDQLALSCGSHLSAECLKQVDKYLAAHFAAATENTLSIKSEKDPCCGGSVTYGFQFGEGILGTPFGQMANTLSCGCLAEFDKQPVNLFSIGSHGNC